MTASLFLPSVKIQVPHGLRRFLAERDLVVVENDPSRALLEDVADIVADVHRLPNVRDDATKFVQGGAVAQLRTVVRGIGVGGIGGRLRDKFAVVN